MHDNLRLRRLIQLLANQVEAFVRTNNDQQTDDLSSSSLELSQAHHQEIMCTAKAVFKEMSLQVACCKARAS